MLPRTALSWFLSASLLLIGCGTSSNTTPTPGSPHPNPSTAPDSYLATVIVSAGRHQVEEGQITVDTTAKQRQPATHKMWTGTAAWFCSFVPIRAPSRGIDVTSLTTDANGQLHLAAEGNLLGIFQLVSSGSQVAVTATGSPRFSYGEWHLGPSHVERHQSEPHVQHHRMQHFLATPCAALASITTDGQGNVSADLGFVPPAACFASAATVCNL
jgi:hypothetical protein